MDQSNILASKLILEANYFRAFIVGKSNNFIGQLHKFENNGDRCRKNFVEDQRVTHMVNSNFNFSQNVKMGQGRELPGKPLEP